MRILLIRRRGVARNASSYFCIIMKTIKEKLAKLLTQKIGIEIKPESFTCPPNAAMGDLALPCFELGKSWGKNPAEAAKNAIVMLSLSKHGNAQLKKAEVMGPYVNFTFKPAFLAKSVFKGAQGGVRDRFAGARDDGSLRSRGKVMIEYSQPNTHKEFHIGHLRNACLGASLVNLHRYLGNNVIAANYIGDTGVHVAKCLWNLQKFHAGEALPENKGEYLGKLYAEAVSRLEADEKLLPEVSAVQKKLEKGDKELTALWQKTKEWSLESFYDIYKLLNNNFDVWFWESEEEKKGKGMIRRMLKNNLLPEVRVSEGAVIADLSAYGLDVLVLIKSDGNVLYGAKDLPLGIKKFKKFHVKKSIYVVDKRQELYLKQIFKLLDLLGYADKEKIHVSYDFVTLPEGAMASRKGNVVTFETFYAEVLQKSVAETKQRHADWSTEKVNDVAAKISLAAIKFFMLKYDNGSVIVFDADKALAFDGDTGPYLLYALARINSILVKAEEVNGADQRALKDPTEKSLMMHMLKFDEAVLLAAEENAPARICSYLIELAQAFNTFYHHCPVLQADEKTKAARLALCGKVRELLGKGLNLLNISIINEM